MSSQAPQLLSSSIGGSIVPSSSSSSSSSCSDSLHLPHVLRQYPSIHGSSQWFQPLWSSHVYGLGFPSRSSAQMMSSQAPQLLSSSIGGSIVPSSSSSSSSCSDSLHLPHV